MIPATLGPKIPEMARNRNFDRNFSGILNLAFISLVTLALTSPSLSINALDTPSSLFNAMSPLSDKLVATSKVLETKDSS
jgi:hypothetical protein